jgi:hypothetical protein
MEEERLRAFWRILRRVNERNCGGERLIVDMNQMCVQLTSYALYWLDSKREA